MPDTDPNLAMNQSPSVHVMNDDPLVGLDLGGYRVTKLLAMGGMGLVYEAMHPTIGRRAAVKVLKPEVAGSDEWSKRFVSEARALGSLKHRNLIEVLNFGKTPDGREFLMMEFLDGEPLDAYIRRLTQLTPSVALSIVDQILNGLAEAHKKGVVHRDLKPSNVFLLREHNGELLVKVLDFGLARQEPVTLTDTAIHLPKLADGASLLAGTPEYIAPEQAQGLKVDASADLYSVGVMLFEMVTGRLPFEAQSVSKLLQKHLSERQPRLSSLMRNVPDGLEELVAVLMEKQPDRRPKSADIARVAVQRLLRRMQQDSTVLRPAAVTTDDPKGIPSIILHNSSTVTDKALRSAFPERRKRRWALLALLLLLLLGSASVWWGRSRAVSSPVPPVVAVASPVQPVAVEAVEVKPAEVPAMAETMKEEVVPLVEVLKPAKLPTPRSRIVVDRSPCEPTDAWKKRVGLDIAEMANLVSSSAEKSRVYETEGRRVDELVRSASTVGECATAQTAFDGLRSKLGL
jgi:serine/threonine protein kinase